MAAVEVESEVAAAAPAPVAWTSDIAFENAATSDGRYILDGALSWRDLPLPLMGLLETGPGGHEGAFIAGRIDKIRRDKQTNMAGDSLPAGMSAVRASGEFDVQGDFGAEVARLVGDETVRGVSIDMAVDAWVFRDPATGELIDPDTADEVDMERAMMGDLQFAVKAGTILAATVCPTPAFADARIALSASGDGRRVIRLWAELRVEGESLTASAAGMAPVKPPHAWFTKPETKGPTPLTVTPAGQVYGHIAEWGTCHTGKQGVCQQAPTSPSGYAYFNLGEIECADGQRVACGQITMGTLHADLNKNWQEARHHYEHTGRAIADIRATDGAYGIWVAGAVRPDATAKQVRELTAAKPSGDWRQITPGGPLEMIGALEVNVPGFPVVRTEARLVASAAHPEGEVVALIAASGPSAVDGLERRTRVMAARAVGGIDALAELAGV
jgi:hypothetical protein